MYIGLTKRTLSARLTAHFYAAQRGMVTHLANAIRKYGKDNFYIEPLEEVLTEDQAKERESFLICRNDTYHHGYNMTLGGDGLARAVGYKWLYNPLLGREMRCSDPELIQSLIVSGWFMGRSSSIKQKISKSKIGCTGPNAGKSPSQQTRDKIRNSLIGRKRPDIAIKLRGRKQPREYVERRANSLRSRYQLLCTAEVNQ